MDNTPTPRSATTSSRSFPSPPATEKDAFDPLAAYRRAEAPCLGDPIRVERGYASGPTYSAEYVRPTSGTKITLPMPL